MNSFGQLFRLTTFGESHGPAIGGIIDGMPAGVAIDTDAIARELRRRRPGQSSLVTSRSESDGVTILSGIFEGITTGTPIGFTIPNTDCRPADYEEMRHIWRPSHADMTYAVKYGHRDHRGGGRASARETAARVVGGAFARHVLTPAGIRITAYTSQVGPVSLTRPYSDLDLESVESNDMRCPDTETAIMMTEYVKRVMSAGDSVGGVISCVISGVPAGLGQPVFDKLQSRLAAAMLSIPAAKGFDYGLGFEDCGRLGSELIDELIPSPTGGVTSPTNHSGGIQGGISTGADIYFRVAFKPVATLRREVRTVTDTGETTLLNARGRHDACVLPRAIPIVEAMAAMVLLDAILLDRATRLTPQP